MVLIKNSNDLVGLDLKVNIQLINIKLKKDLQIEIGVNRLEDIDENKYVPVINFYFKDQTEPIFVAEFEQTLDRSLSLPEDLYISSSLLFSEDLDFVVGIFLSFALTFVSKIEAEKVEDNAIKLILSISDKYYDELEISPAQALSLFDILD